MTGNCIDYTSRPSALRYMAQGVRPSPGWKASRGVPDLRLTWHDFRLVGADVERLIRVTGEPERTSPAQISVLLPHVSGFRLLMVMLTHAAWPLPIWNALQLRNRLIQHRQFVLGDRYQLQTRALGWRVLDKGIEIDLHTRLLQGTSCFWESVVTFYYRGRFGAAMAQGELRAAPAVAPLLSAQAPIRWQGRINSARRWQFGHSTGDYNPSHLSDTYARRMGFGAAFAHSQRLAALGLSNLAPIACEGQQLDLWLKGPVAYGSQVIQRQSERLSGAGQVFGLWRSDDDRPALVGHWKALAREGSMD